MTPQLIVIEGIDDAGRAALGRRLVSGLRAHGVEASWHPNRPLEPAHSALDRIARGRGHADRRVMLGQDRADLLSAALKVGDWLDITTAPGDDVRVIDQYYYACLALAHAEGVVDTRWLRGLFAALPEPDLVLLLSVPAATVADDSALSRLDRLAEGYRMLSDRAPGRFRGIDAGRGDDDSYHESWRLLSAIIRGRLQPDVGERHETIRDERLG